jgi:electron transfer flavoprotein alpha subunit
MKSIVLVKQVPTVGDLAFDPVTRTLKRDGVRLEVSAFDVRALVRAIELRAQVGGEVVALTMGPPQARDALAYCLALGADRGIHLLDPAFAGADTLATARALAAALRREGFDLVLCGRASVDAETGQVGPEVAELLDLPQVSCARRLDVEDGGGRIRAECETDGGFEIVACALPALVSAAEDLAEERFPRRADREAARDRPIGTVTAADLPDDPAAFGAAGSPTSVAGLEAIDVARAGEVIEGDLPGAVERLVVALVARGLFAPAATAPAVARPVRRRPGDPAKALWVVAETREGGLRRVTLELLGKAGELAAQSGGEVVAVLIGHDVRRHAAALGRAGAERVLVLDDPALAPYATEPHATALADLVRARAPAAVLLASTYRGRDLAPRVAARLGLGLTGDCIDLTLDDAGRLVQWKPAFGGNVVAPILSRTVPAMATVRPGILTPAPAAVDAAPVVETIAFATPALRRVTLVARRPAPGVERAAALDEAEIAIGVGVGIGGPEALVAIEAFAAALGGAAIAATRDVTDKGWLPRQHQVGLTGRAIAPRFYFAIGVRGAFEHMVGLRRAGTVVAVNRNVKAPIFKQADVGIVADWATVLGPLGDEIRRRRRDG